MGLLRRHQFLFQVLLTVVLVALFVRRIDVVAAFRHIGVADARWILLAVGVITASRLVQSYRWWLFLSGRWRLPLAPLTGIYLVSQLANTLMPLRAGDVLRVQIASRRFGIPHAELAATVFVVESVLDWLTGMAVFLAGLVVVNPPFFPRTLVALLAAVVAAAFAGTVWLARMDRSRDLSAMPPIRWLPRRTRPVAAKHGRQFLDGLAALRDTGHTVPVMAVALLVMLLEVVVYWSLGQAFGLDLRLAEYIVIMVGANIVLAVPLTPWSIGSFEIAVIEVSGLLGVDRAAAGGYAVGAHLVLMLWLNVIGLAAVWALGLSLRDLFGTTRQPHGRAEQPAARERR